MKTQHTPGPWEIDWYRCTMDFEDVQHAKQNGNKDARMGDEMWRVPVGIGPIQIDHNHWAGHNLGIEAEDAFLVAAAPDLLEALEGYMVHCKPNSVEGDEAYCIARAAISKAKGESC